MLIIASYTTSQAVGHPGSLCALVWEVEFWFISQNKAKSKLNTYMKRLGSVIRTNQVMFILSLGFAYSLKWQK